MEEDELNKRVKSMMEKSDRELRMIDIRHTFVKSVGRMGSTVL